MHPIQWILIVKRVRREPKLNVLILFSSELRHLGKAG